MKVPLPLRGSTSIRKVVSVQDTEEGGIPNVNLLLVRTLFITAWLRRFAWSNAATEEHLRAKDNDHIICPLVNPMKGASSLPLRHPGHLALTYTARPGRLTRLFGTSSFVGGFQA
jgi:hypothetical protein